ncbi:MAG: HNH endonuclease [Candidatus Gracilibacteria bacterium]
MNSLDEQLNNLSISVRPVIEAGIIAGTSLGLLQDVSKGWSSIQNESQNQFQNVKPGSSGEEGAGQPFSKSVKNAVHKQNENCVFCGTKTTDSSGPTQTNIDHAIPRARGGDNTLNNAQNTCRTCNLKKGMMDSFEFINKLKDAKPQ